MLASVRKTLEEMWHSEIRIRSPHPVEPAFPPSHGHAAWSPHGLHLRFFPEDHDECLLGEERKSCMLIGKFQPAQVDHSIPCLEMEA